MKLEDKFKEEIKKLKEGFCYDGGITGRIVILCIYDYSSECPRTCYYVKKKDKSRKN